MKSKLNFFTRKKDLGETIKFSSYGEKLSLVDITAIGKYNIFKVLRLKS
jgi:hypothetical protein